MWLRDYLPGNFQSCRVLLYGYDSKVLVSKSNQSVQEIASMCKNVLLGFRKLTETNINILQILSQEREQKSFPRSCNLLSSSIGFLGYGVPMNGLKNESLLNLVRGQHNFEMIQSICIENNRPTKYLHNLATRFSLCQDMLSVYYFHETNPSDDRIDSQASPQRNVDDPGAVGRENNFWVPRNHSELVKFSSRNDEVYTTTKLALSLILKKLGP
ncbi:hypothetical protein F4781DRAFT_419537 [Annulohypoxylon bovei var. microspora]|nr:hypothetical protein F4781DRAFT_419537 [Annulohypoxylon bovei var. microspora]